MTPMFKLALSCALAGALVASPASAQTGGKLLTATLSGANDVPPTTETATGTASVTVNPGKGEICWEITTTGFSDTDTITATHIHSGQSGANGGIIVHLAATKNGTNSGCTTTVQPGGAALTRDQIDAIRKAPQVFYVNVHTSEFPNGAIRGQLG